jgi:hypothetical protein
MKLKLPEYQLFAERQMNKMNSIKNEYCRSFGRFATRSSEARQRFTAGSSGAGEKQGLDIGVRLWFVTALPQMLQGFATDNQKNEANYLSFG